MKNTSHLRKSASSADNCPPLRASAPLRETSPSSFGFRVSDFTNLPYKFQGRTRAGIDCVGLVLLYLQEQLSLTITPPTRVAAADFESTLPQLVCLDPAIPVRRHDLVFFRQGRRLRHVAIVLEDAPTLATARLLHATAGGSRIDNGPTLLARTGLYPCLAITPQELANNPALLSSTEVRVQALIGILISVALAVASAYLTPRPKLGQNKNQSGRYGFDQLWTQTNPTLPLADVLGQVVVAGNSPYQSRIDRSVSTSMLDEDEQRANKVVVLASGPVAAFTYENVKLKINGVAYDDTYFHGAGGFYLNPAQTKAEAVDGTFTGAYMRSSVTTYDGAPAITVPVDIRAAYDRTFPVYGFAGCAYMVFRMINAQKFTTFNVNAVVKGRLCRTFTSTGFTTATATAESLAGADASKTRFKLAQADIKSVSSVTVNSVAYTETAEDNNGDLTYVLNREKGFLEFISPPPASATVEITYIYYVRAWTQNPADHVVYLLTEAVRGKGVAEDRIDWPRAVEARNYFDEPVPWTNGNGNTVETRYRCNYAIDYRKPIQDHLRAVLDSCYSSLFLSDGKFVLKPRRSGASIFSFNSSNILVERSGDSAKATFVSELADRSARANRVKVLYHSADTYNSETEAARDDLADQAGRAARFGNAGQVEESLSFPAINGIAQAERLAETILRENVSSRWIVEFATTIKGIALEPGDIIDVTHDTQPAWSAKLFRVEELTLDDTDRLTIRASEYTPAAYF
jgi:hypothetical protein